MGVDYNVGQVFFNSAIFQTLAILGMYTFIAEVLCLDKKQRKIFFVVFFIVQQKNHRAFHRYFGSLLLFRHTGWCLQTGYSGYFLHPVHIPRSAATF